MIQNDNESGEKKAAKTFHTKHIELSREKKPTNNGDLCDHGIFYLVAQQLTYNNNTHEYNPWHRFSHRMKNDVFFLLLLLLHGRAHFAQRAQLVELAQLLEMVDVMHSFTKIAYLNANTECFSCMAMHENKLLKIYLYAFCMRICEKK